MKLSIILLSTLIALTSFGVSRIGGGKVQSHFSHAELTLPSPFQALEQYENMVLANGPMGVLGAGQMVPQYIQVYEFKDKFANLATSGRQDIETYLTEKTWQKVDFFPGTCVDTYWVQSSSGVGIIATWGQGKGIFMMGPATGDVQYALSEAMKSLMLAPGACAW